MKKILSIVILVLALGALAVTASADNVPLYDPVKADFGFWSTDALNSYVTINSSEYEGNVGVTSRTFDTTTASGRVSSSMRYAPIIQDADGNHVHGGTVQCRWKSNFVWDFDFTIDQMPAQSTSADQGLIIQIGDNLADNYKNSIRITPPHTSTPGKCYIRWGGGTQAMGAGISMPNESAYLDAAYLIEEGKTYHLKIEVDLTTGTTSSDAKGPGGQIYVTFTNPYVIDDTTGLPYTKTTTSIFPITALSTVEDITSDKSATFTLTAVQPMKFTLSNEKLYVDKYRVMTPSISLSEAQLSASAAAINATPCGYSNAVLPTLILAVYNENDEMVKLGCGIKTETIYGLTSKDCTAAVEALDTLPNGTYTAKAFVCNSLSGLKSYKNTLEEQTFTVSDGVVSLN